MSASLSAPAARVEALFLRLEGPLMAWGDGSAWTVRHTRWEPTKSGVLGLLAACLGWARGSSSDGKIAALSDSILLAVRADRPGAVLRDYHTVVGGVVSAEGKIKVTQSTKELETVVSERYYLSDACFLAVLFGPSATLDTLESALIRPAWPPFLGRKSCSPSVPLFPAVPGRPSRETYDSPEAALTDFPFLGRGQPPPRLRALIELPPGAVPPDAPLQRRRDVPLALSARRFGYRSVYEMHLPPPAGRPDQPVPDSTTED